MMAVNNLALASTAIVLQILSAFLLSFCFTATTTHPATSELQATNVQKATILAGSLAGTLTICLPYLVDNNDPLIDCVLRVVCFFYGCKILDLAVSRARNPPMLLNAGQPEAIESASARFKYVWLLLTETRYSAFDIAVQQKERDDELSSVWTFAAPLVVPALVYAVPSPETKSLAALLIIQIGLECLHATLHPFCSRYLFWKPFAASSLTTFWRTHWHGSAETFLRSLGYVPGKELALWMGLSQNLARAFGVVSAFNLTGIWHGWATAALATRPWMVGLRVWALFVGMGFGVILESTMPRSWRVSLPHRVFVWIFVIFVSYLFSFLRPRLTSLKWAGWAWRGLQSNCKVQWLAEV